MTEQIFYQKDRNQAVRVWKIRVDKVSDFLSRIVINAGQENGKFIETITDITSGKNIGRSNETSVYQQAIQDAETEINRKVKSGYVTDYSQMKSKGQTATINAPMKAETYHSTGYFADGTLKKGCFTLDGKVGSKKQETIHNGFLYCERKYDGWRFRIFVDRNDIIFYTSSGDETLSFPQIEKRIRKVFDKNIDYWESKYGVTSYMLDGEIFNLEEGFQKSASACASVINITPEKQALRDKMQFHIFDVAIEDKNVLLETRKKICKYFVDNISIMEVESILIPATVEEIEKKMKQFLEEGHEGLMLRVPETPYEFKRSKHIYKYKPLMDDEFQITGFTKSITGETLGSFECTMPNGTKIFPNPIYDLGFDEMKKEIWDNQSKYLGKWITVIFLEMTNDGIPRHPRAKSFRKGKSKD